MTQATHTAVCGPSGGGKTTYVRKQHATTDTPSVFLTTKDFESNVKGIRVRGRKALNTLAKRATRPSDAKAKWFNASYPGAIQTVRKWALDVREHMGWAVQVIVDESQNAPTFSQGDSGPCKRMLHEDRAKGIKCVVVTQNPQDWHSSQLKYGPIQQCPYWVFVGPLKDFHVGFLRGNNLNNLIPHMPTEDFEYVTVEPTASLSAREKVRYRGRTKEKYG